MKDDLSPLPSRPYPGLRPYSYKDRAVFFGREDQSFALYRLVDANGFVAVVGSSGSGKSSLVLAGLLPLITDEREQGGRKWRWESMVPGDDPIAALAELLTDLSNDTDTEIRSERRRRIEYQLRRSSFGLADALREVDGFENQTLLLVIDQFEEIFRLAAPESSVPALEAELARDEATRFVQILLEANRDPKVDIHIVITMRSDFIGDCARFHGLPEAVSRHQYLVPALTRDQREQVIVGPLKKFGASMDPELVERLLNDCDDDMDQLPVLQHALLRLWEFAGNRQENAGEGAAPRRLTPDDYTKIDKLSGALSLHANEILDKLGKPSESDVEYVFRALSRIDAERRIVRRTLKFSDLRAETGIDGERLQLVLRPFRADDCSFILPLISKLPELHDETLVRVGHEALLRGWEKVSGDPTGIGGQLGWCYAEDADGQTYRNLLFNVDSDAETLPLNSVNRYATWWRQRRRTDAWAERYGGRRAEVEKLITDSKRELRNRRLLRIGLCVALVPLTLSAIGLYVWDAHKNALASQRIESVTGSAQKVIVQVSASYGRGEVTAKGAQDLLQSAEDIVKSIDAAELTPAGRRAKISYLLAVADLAASLLNYGMANEDATSALDTAEPLITADPASEDTHQLAASAAWRMGVARFHLDKLPDHNKVTTEAFDRSLMEAETAVQNGGSGDVKAQEVLSVVLARYGEWKLKLRLPKETTGMYKRSLDVLTPLANDKAASRDLRGEWASALQRVGRDALANQDVVAARKYLTDAFNARVQIVSEDTNNSIFISNLTTSYSDMAKLAWLDNRWREALDDRAKVDAEQTKLMKKDPTNTSWKILLVFDLDADIADLKRSLDMPDATDSERTVGLQRIKADYNEIIRIKEELADRDPADVRRRRDLALSVETFGDFLAGQKITDAAESMYNKAINNWTVVRESQSDCKDCTDKAELLTNKLAALQTAQP